VDASSVMALLLAAPRESNSAATSFIFEPVAHATMAKVPKGMCVCVCVCVHVCVCVLLGRKQVRWLQLWVETLPSNPSEYFFRNA
jgi:hypothetical protein